MRKEWFCEMESTPVEDTVKTVQMTTKGIDCYTNLVDKVARFERIDPNFERSSIVGKCYQTASDVKRNLS